MTSMEANGGGGPNRAAAAQAGSSQQAIVLVWDLDETLIIFNSMLNGEWAQKHRQGQHSHQGLDSKAALHLGQEMADCIFQFLDDHFLYSQVENLDPMHIVDMHVHYGAHSSSGGGIPPTVCLNHPTAPGGLSSLLHLAPDHSYSSAQTVLVQANHPGAHHHHHTIIHPPASTSDTQRSDVSTCTDAQQHARAQCAKRTLTDVNGSQDNHVTAAPHDHNSHVNGWIAKPASPHQAGAQPSHSNHSPCADGSAAQLKGSSPTHETQEKRMRMSVDVQLSSTEVFARAVRVYQSGLQSVSSTSQSRFDQLLETVEKVSGRWVEAAKQLLTGINTLAEQQGLQVHHCIVSTGQLMATLGKLMMFGLAQYFPPDQVYSASKQTKLAAFKKIRQRWGVQAHYLAVGDGGEECRAAGAMRWPFIQISITPAPSSMQSRQASTAWSRDGSFTCIPCDSNGLLGGAHHSHPQLPDTFLQPLPTLKVAQHQHAASGSAVADMHTQGSGSDGTGDSGTSMVTPPAASGLFHLPCFHAGPMASHASSDAIPIPGAGSAPCSHPVLLTPTGSLLTPAASLLTPLPSYVPPHGCPSSMDVSARLQEEEEQQQQQRPAAGVQQQVQLDAGAVPECGLSIHQLWPQFVLDCALAGRPAR